MPRPSSFIVNFMYEEENDVIFIRIKPELEYLIEFYKMLTIICINREKSDVMDV
jgi:hypothetical protein